jgi:hypothetical protein
MKRYVDPSAWRLASIPWRAAFRIEPEEIYLARFQNYQVARMIEDYVPPGARVLSPQQIAEAYTSREILVGNQSGEGQLAMDLLWNPLMPESEAHGRSEFRFKPRALRKVRVVQTASGSDLWSIAELRVLHAGRELPRSRDWRLRARPNPWDVQLAFDNTPVTRWRSWQKLEDGMTIEVDFGLDQIIDTVRLEVSRDQYQIRLRLEGEDAYGNVTQLAGEPQEYDVAPPAGLRAAAAEELKARRIDYLVIHESDFRASDFYQRQSDWNIELVAERGEGKLYRIK